MAFRTSRVLGACALSALALAPGCNLIFGINGGEPGAGGGGSHASSTSSSSGSGGSTSSSSGTGGGDGGPVACSGGGPKGDITKAAKAAPGDDYEGGRAVAFGADKSLYWTGYYASVNTAFGANTLPYPGGNGANAWDLFVVRYDEGGNHVWSRGFNGPLDQEPMSIAVSPSGEVAIAGVMDGSADFDGHPITANAVQADRIDAFVLKLVEQNGAPQVAWSAHFGGDQDEVAEKIAFDAAGDVIVAGRVNGPVDFGACGAKATSNGHGIFVAKLDKMDGHCVWVNLYEGYTQLVNKYGDQGLRVSFVIEPSSGDILLAGGAINPNFGEGPLSTQGDPDAFVVRLSGDTGAHKKSRAFSGELGGGDGLQHARSIALDPCGDIYLGGSFTRKATFGNDVLTEASTGPGEADYLDAFVAKLHGDTLLPIWAKGFGDAGDQHVLHVSADAFGNVLLAGRILDDALSVGVDFGGGKLLGGGEKPGEGYYSDFFAAKLDPTGAHVWSKRLGTTSLEIFQDGALSSDGRWALTGLFNSTLDFGGGSQPLSSSYFDGFLVVFGP